MSDSWYINLNNSNHGPFTLEQVENLWDKRQINESTLISSDGKEFVPLAKVFEIDSPKTRNPAPRPPSPPNPVTIDEPRGYDPQPKGGRPDDSNQRIISQVGEKVAAVAGVEKLEGFNFGVIMSDVFRRHSKDDIEEKFAVGAPKTTPPITEVDASWPKPWVFFRALAVSIIAYIVLTVTYQHYENDNLLPAIIMIGTFAVPFATLLFFFESNVVNNVSFYQVLRTFLIGGVLSLIVALFLFSVADLIPIFDLEPRWSAVVAAFVEEPAKFAAVLIATRYSRHPYILNGLLLGAAIGTGFAAFESAGYAFRFLTSGGLLDILTSDFSTGFERMTQVINTRGVLAPFGHIPWTAAYCAAFWKARSQNLSFKEALLSPIFLRVFATSVALHALWNSPINLPFFYTKFIILGFIGWIVVFSLLQSGLKEIRQRKGEQTSLL